MVEDGHEKEESFDPWCDPGNPRKLQFEQISAAAYRIRDGIIRTPCDRSHMSDVTGIEMFFKKDYMQYTGSFKERGARYTLLMLSPEEKKKGVIAASAGNHALALAYHGGQLGIPVTVIMPKIAPIMKVENCKKYGARVHIHGQNIDEAKKKAMIIAQEKDMLYINGYDHPHILAGQGTLGLEILEQVPDMDALIIPVGGGGLIAGASVAVKTMKPEVVIIGVEPELCSSFTTALKHGKPIFTRPEASLADGLIVPKVGINAFATAAPLIDKMVSVSEKWVAISILRLVEIEKAVIEGGGATGVAAILSGILPELKGKKVVIPLCGGNIDTTVLGRCIERGLAADGRLVKFTVIINDRPGGIAELADLLSKTGVSIKDVVHERAWLQRDIFSVEIKVVAETRNREHTQEMFRVLEERYSHVNILTGRKSLENDPSNHYDSDSDLTTDMKDLRGSKDSVSNGKENGTLQGDKGASVPKIDFKPVSKDAEGSAAASNEAFKAPSFPADRPKTPSIPSRGESAAKKSSAFYVVSKKETDSPSQVLELISPSPSKPKPILSPPGFLRWCIESDSYAEERKILKEERLRRQRLFLLNVQKELHNRRTELMSIAKANREKSTTPDASVQDTTKKTRQVTLI